MPKVSEKKRVCGDDCGGKEKLLIDGKCEACASTETTTLNRKGCMANPCTERQKLLADETNCEDCVAYERAQGNAR